MLEKYFLLGIMALFGVLIFSAFAYACGCGIAISDIMVFNGLRETQAYLLIDVQNESAYEETPFFQLFSMDRPYNVTIVFPMNSVPYDVQAKSLNTDEFLRQVNIDNVESAGRMQNASELQNAVDKPLFSFSNGVVASAVYNFVLSLFSGPVLENAVPQYGGAVEGARAIAPVSHFEFTGGSLDIYNVSSQQTLDEFVKTIDINTTDAVRDLVVKYKDYYVAVLYLKVPSVVNESDIELLEKCTPDALEDIKNSLQGGGGGYYNMRQAEDEIDKNGCGEEALDALGNYRYSAGIGSSDINGTAVTMKFSNSNSIFYPVSIVNSYKYPISEQGYYIKVPGNLHANLSSSHASSIISLGGERWYKISSTKEDVRGEIVPATADIGMQDSWRGFVQFLYVNHKSIIFILYLLMVGLPLLIVWKREKLDKEDFVLSAASYFIGGLILSSIVMLVRKRKQLAAIYFVLWVVLFLFAFT